MVTISPVKLQLLGRLELERVLGLSRTRVAQLLEEPDFPDCVSELAMGKVWALMDIEAYAELKGRTLHPLGAANPD